MQFRYLFTFLFLSFSTSLFAGSIVDSIGVENSNGKEVIIYKVEAKDTYYQLGRKFSIPAKTIQLFNDSKALKPGMLVKIPTERPFEHPKQVQAGDGKPAVQKDAPIIEYKVGPKETLYAISKRFNTTVEDLSELNNLKDNNLVVGQVLKVRQQAPGQAVAPEEKKAPVVTPAPVQNEPKTVIAPPDTNTVDAKLKQNKYGLREHDERGVGVWIADENLDGSKMLALHRSVPPGTVIKVTNPMTGISAYVKVLGKFTENETTKDVIIVITKAVADRIGILDKRFQITIVYGVSNDN
ncbi:septal ring lytic transglycosylase RlpA family protein [Hufsiella ginkgonis]|uniref:LysM peptidoglycan-binding domain-containing protein n=1 Tax=Hufsiella ginkgonis TaxID=2695274 RepID=A0A7K1XWY8_9SPHI|nr:LysM peptidoglycan-binding domain-containing protein [Hufsiella ginkgonis]MXV15524.1 LysM peptidoglycan-binding domain-containing protein [Hufsiella ginkgonis]